MKKMILTVAMIAGLFASVNAGTLTANTPFGPLNLEVADDFTPPKEVFVQGATKRSGSFPVIFDDGITHVTFPVYFDDGATMEDIINVLWSLFF